MVTLCCILSARIQNSSVVLKYLYFLLNFQSFQDSLCIHQISLEPSLMSSEMTAASLIPTNYNVTEKNIDNRQQLSITSASGLSMSGPAMSGTFILLGNTPPRIFLLHPFFWLFLVLCE